MCDIFHHMRCPFCGNTETKVTNSRTSDNADIIRRRRECLKCNKRFSTLEKTEDILLFILKKDGSQQLFDRNKLLSGILRAVEKRDISRQQCEDMVDRIESTIKNQFKSEIKASELGDMVLKELMQIDKVAYIRFASVYREFKDLNEFTDELNRIVKN